MYNFRFHKKTCSFDGFYIVLWCLETYVRMRSPSALLRRGSLIGVIRLWVPGCQYGVYSGLMTQALVTTLSIPQKIVLDIRENEKPASGHGTY
jgi:hypothetical protein